MVLGNTYCRDTFPFQQQIFFSASSRRAAYFLGGFLSKALSILYRSFRSIHWYALGCREGSQHRRCTESSDLLSRRNPIIEENINEYAFKDKYHCLEGMDAFIRLLLRLQSLIRVTRNDHRQCDKCGVVK